MAHLFDQPSDMEPLVPADPGGDLERLGWEVIRRAERLSGVLHPVTAREIANLVRVMNSYYSNLIEGHHTHPADLEAAVKRQFSGDRAHRDLQQLHAAHLNVQQRLEQTLDKQPDLAITDSDFLCGIHRELYADLPQEMRKVKNAKGKTCEVAPGAVREFEVSVGVHLAPAHSAVAAFMNRFHDFYASRVQPTGPGLVACAASHHRLAWIHPFGDGNGRVARLFSHAWFIRSRASAHSLFTVSRGFARHLDRYRSTLAGADEKRRNDFDGRGYLSEKGLADFVWFFLETTIDQLEFMEALLQLPELIRRIEGFAKLGESAGDLPKGSANLLRDVCLRGEIPRGDVARIVNKGDRSARDTIGRLLEDGYLTSPSPKGPLRIGFPPRAAAAYFPELYPGGI